MGHPGQADHLHYTVSDKDKFTASGPPPPPGPYGPPAYPQDNIRLVSFSWGTADWTISVDPGVGNQWATQTQFTVDITSNNYTGYEQQVNFGLGWDDRADGPQGVPQWAWVGDCDDASRDLSKTVALVAN